MKEIQQLTTKEAAEKIFTEKGLTIDDAEVRDEFIADIEQAINDHIDGFIMDSLNEDQLKQLDVLSAKKASAADIREFINANVNNLSDLVARAIIEVRNIYLSN